MIKTAESLASISSKTSLYVLYPYLPSTILDTTFETFLLMELYS